MGLYQEYDFFSLLIAFSKSVCNCTAVCPFALEL